MNEMLQHPEAITPADRPQCAREGCEKSVREVPPWHRGDPPKYCSRTCSGKAGYARAKKRRVTRAELGERKRTIDSSRFPKSELRRLAVLYPDDGATAERPRTRGECIDGPRPCPWVGCRMHLAIDVNRKGNITENFPSLELEELLDTCALDVADRGGLTLEETGLRMNITRERVRQLEERAKRRLPRDVLAAYVPGESAPDPAAVGVRVDAGYSESVEDILP